MRSLRVTGAALAVLTASCTIVQTDPGSPGYVSSGSAALEVNVDRPGSDYRSFDLGTPRPEECRDTCMVEPQCVAFTYVNPGVQGPSARCWLKSAVPAATPNACCVSGVKSAPPSATAYAAPPPPPPPAAPPPPTAWRATPPPPPPPPPSTLRAEPPRGEHHGMEHDVDRPGSDFANFDLPEARPHLCKEACMRDSRCLAFTYVNPGVQGPNARCWLKNSVPNPVANRCCTSGVKNARGGYEPQGGSGFEMNIDRPGYDFANFDLPQANPALCRDACMNNGTCLAFTYVNPGVQGPNARCWLKNSVPPATQNACCVSGVK
jgi:hypothetical protein